MFTAAAAVAVAATAVMTVYVRCAPREIGRSYADIDIKTLNATKESDVDYYLIKGVSNVNADNFDEYLEDALIAEKGNLEISDTSMVFERLLAKTEYQLIFTSEDVEGNRVLAGTYSFTTGPGESPFAEKLEEIFNKIKGKHENDRDDDTHEESRADSSEALTPEVETSSVPPVSESVPEVIPPSSSLPESISSVPAPVQPEVIPSEVTSSEASQDERPNRPHPKPTPNPDPGPGPGPDPVPPTPPEGGMTGDAADYTASENAAMSGVEFNVEFPFTLKNTQAELINADFEAIYDDPANNVKETIPAAEFVRTGDTYTVKRSGIVRHQTGVKLGMVARYKENGVEKTTPQTIFEASPSYFKEPYGDFPQAGDTVGAIENYSQFTEGGKDKFRFDINIRDIVNPRKPADSYLQISSINMLLIDEFNEMNIHEYLIDSNKLPNGGKVTGTTFNYSGTIDLPTVDGSYIVRLDTAADWMVKNGPGNYTGFHSSYLPIEPADRNYRIVIGTPDVDILVNPNTKYSADNKVTAKITGLSLSPDKDFSNAQRRAKPGTTMYAQVLLTADAQDDYNVTDLQLEVFGGGAAFTQVVTDPADKMPTKLLANQNKTLVYSFTVPEKRTEVQLKSFSAENGSITLSAPVSEITKGNMTATLTGISKTAAGPFAESIRAPKGTNSEGFAEVLVKNNSAGAANVDALTFGANTVTGFTLTGKTLPVTVAPGTTETLVYKFTSAGSADTISLASLDVTENAVVTFNAQGLKADNSEVTATITGLSLDPAGTFTDKLSYLPTAEPKSGYVKVLLNNPGQEHANFHNINLAGNTGEITFTETTGKPIPIFIKRGTATELIYKFQLPKVSTNITPVAVSANTIYQLQLADVVCDIVDGIDYHNDYYTVSNIETNPPMIVVPGMEVGAYEDIPGGNTVTVRATLTVTYPSTSSPNEDLKKLAIYTGEYNNQGGITYTPYSDFVELTSFLNKKPEPLVPDAQGNITRTGTFTVTINHRGHLNELIFGIEDINPIP